MARRKWTQEDLAAKSGISQTHIGNILRQETAATNEKIEAIAAAFKLPSWLLMVPDLPIEVLDSPQIPALVEHFTRLAIERNAL